jgi:tetratricopeptide (TPR) repeat protein
MSTVRALLVVACGLPILTVSALTATAEPDHFVWVDEDGHTHFTNDPAAVPDDVRGSGSPDWDETRALWDRWILGERTGTPPGAGGSEADRVTRLVRGAVRDLQRGETSRAAATLKSVVELDPTRAEAHWYLALLDRQRGRYDSSESHLRSFLSYADPSWKVHRASAEKRLQALDDERRLADRSRVRGEMLLVQRESPNFRIRVDSELDRVRTDYATTALRYLEDARADVSVELGVEPDEPLGVVFYGRARYDQEHRHRFSFATVGFFDGRIHVASPAHPSGELRSLLFHEYTHALFREQTGGDRPYWLNEGLAERVERGSRRVPASTHSERASLRARIADDSWIPLHSIARSFSGLSNEDARIAYLEAVAATSWIEKRTSREQRAKLLARLGEGFSVDQALHEALGVDTDGLDAAVREEIRSEFPEMVEVGQEGQ